MTIKLSNALSKPSFRLISYIKNINKYILVRKKTKFKICNKIFNNNSKYR